MTLTLEKIQFRSAIKLILPREHGSWSLVLEPVAFGLLVAPSAAGAALALAAVAGFFLRRPMKLLLSGKYDPRQPLAVLCFGTLLFVALASLLLAARFSGVEKLWPLLLAALAGLVFVWCDSRNEAREGAAEVAGAAAFGILPAAFGALAGWSVADSLALATMMLVRGVPTVLTVRACLRIRKASAVSITPALVAVGAGIFLILWMVMVRLAPWTAVVFAMVFAARTVWLVVWRPRLTARAVGITEAVLGALMVLTLSLTWKSGGW